MNRFFKIPAGAIIEPDANAADLYIKHDLVRAWYREVREIDGQMTPVVVLQRMDFDVPTDAALVRDGEWSQQLESCVGGCTGGDPAPIDLSAVRVAYGGMYQLNPTDYDEIQFTEPGEWVILTNDHIQLLGYEADGTNQIVYDLNENSMSLAWEDPIPKGRQFAQITVFWSVAAVGNDQVYEFGLAFNDEGVTAPSGRAALSFERAGDVETLAQQGQGTVDQAAKLQLAVRNVNGTNPLRLYTVNVRATVTGTTNEAVAPIPTP